MLHSIDCTARINAQDPDYPTYKKIDCTLHCNANDDDFYGKLIDCTVTITTLIVTASKNWDQGIRLLVNIDGVDVSSALVGAINIRHDKNMISTFSLNLGNKDYVPISNSHIDLDKVVIIIAYINGQEKKLFTGLIDNIEVENTPFNITINGFGYGKKLLDKRTTIVSVQDLAVSTKRSDVIKYLAEQAGITNIDIPETGVVTIDNSFSDQSIWDMVQKEAMVDLYWVRFNEDGVMQLRLDDIKTNTTTYPTADWNYGENRFERLNYKKSKEDIINKIIVLGKTTQKRIPVTTSYGDAFTLSKSWAEGDATSWDESYGGWSILYTQTDDEISYERGYIKITHSGGYTMSIISLSTQGSVAVYSKSYPTEFYVKRFKSGGVLQAGGINISFEGSEQSTTYTVRYDQISVQVTDPNSIEKYGEKDGGSVEYPLLETVEQCEAVGAKIIQDSHRNIVNTSFRVPFNPLIIPGQTIEFRDSKIGLTTERYYEEGVTHTINPGGDSGTEVECVYYV